jgi:hypothetical protein
MRRVRSFIVTISAIATLGPVAGISAQSRAYSIDDIIEFVKGGLSSSAILAKTKVSCIDFRVTSESAARLRAAGAGDDLVGRLISNCYKGEAAEVQITPKRTKTIPKPTTPAVVVLHDTVRVRDTVVQPGKVIPAPVVSAPVIPVPAPTLLPEGTEIVANLDQSISSKTAKAGDRVGMTVATDLVVQGKVVVAKGTPVIAEVSEAKGAGRMGRGGKLSIKLLGTTAVDGQRVPLRGSKAESGSGNTGTVVALSVLYGAGLFLHGNDITFKEGSPFHVFVDAQMKIAPQQ